MSVQKILVLFASTTLVLYYIFYRWRNRKFFKLANKLPETNKNWLSILFSLLSSPPSKLTPIMNSLIRNDTPLTKFWLGPSLFILSNDAELIKKVLTSPQCQNKPKTFYKAFLIENSLAISNGDQHKHDRKVFNHAFSHKMMSKLPSIFNAKSKDSFESINEETDEFDPKDFVGSFVAQSFAASQFNYDFNLCQPKVRIVFESFFNSLTKVLPYIICGINIKFLKFTKSGREVNESLKIIKKYTTDVINKYMENGRNDGTSIIDLLHDPKNGFNFDEIFDHIGAFSLSYDTTTKILVAALLMLGIHKDVQDKLHNEIEEIYAENKEASFDLDFLQKFSYLDAVVKETMRLFPAAPVVARETSEDVEVNGYLIPKGTCLILHLYSMHRSEKYWGSDAHLFKPERFQEELKNPLAFSPFTDGNRICIGHRYAMISMKVFLVNLIRTYKIHCPYKFEEVEIELNMTIDIVKGNKIIIQRRQNESTK